MKEIHSNINIIGGGLIGASVAYSLSLLGLKITIIEKNKPYQSKNHEDTRTIAISEGTKNFLAKIDLWPQIEKFAQPIEKIKIIDRKPSNELKFDNKRRGSNLGYIVKNKEVLNALYKKLRERKNVKVFNNSSVKSFEFEDDTISTFLDNKSLNSSLVIAADGKNSYVRKVFKTPTFKKNYKKSAFVTTFTHSKNHNNTAYEFFYKDGPLAILPMLNFNNEFTSSIIWTNNNEYLNNLAEIENIKLSQILNKQTQKSVGTISKILTKQIFPLTAHLNTSFYENRTVYVGDSAHSFHPIAGQGWNLGMSDVESIYNLVKKYRSLGIEVGGNSFCEEYHNNNFYNAYRLYQITDKLDNIFKSQNILFSLGRRLGLGFIQNNKKLSNFISDFAMGIN